MAQKYFLKRFGRTKGLDLGNNHLTRDPLSALKLQNLDLGPAGDLETRRGFKVNGQYAATAPGSADHSYPLHGLDTYQYTDSTTGELRSELIGAGNNLYKQATGRITIAYSGAGAATFSVLPSTSATAQWVADLKVNGTSQAGFPASLGDGTSASYLLKHLRNAINAIANFQCSLTPAAVVNGAQVNRGPAAAVTVFNAYAATTQPHTFSVSTSAATRAELLDRQPAPDERIAVDVIAQTATTLTCKMPDPTATFDVSNNDEIGVGLYSAAILPITNSVSVTPSATISFNYWERIYGPNSSDSILTPSTWETYPNSHNYVMKNHSNNFYIGMPFSIGTDITNYAKGGNPIALRVGPRSTGLLKYDGKRTYAAGVPRPCVDIPTVIAGGALTVGTYKYLVRFRMTDGQGNLIYGTATDDAPEIAMTAVTSAGNQQVEIDVFPPGTDVSLGVVHPYLSKNYAVANGGPQVGTTITVVANSHSLRVGDIVQILDRTSTPAVLVQRLVTAIANTTVTISGANITVNNADYLSGGMVAEIFRTKVGGNSYYLQSEQPIPVGPTTAITFTDNTADDALGIQYDGPFTGNRRKDIPPVVGIIENHQGLLVGAEDPTAPETLYWSNFDSPENWPLGTGQVDIGGDEGGRLTCVISDTSDSLAVFKDDAYHNVSGDLDAGAFSITAYTEGGVGCPSPHGACHFREQIMFLSNKGPRLLQGGQVTEYDTRLLPYFFNNSYEQSTSSAISDANRSKLVLRRAVLANDRDSEKVIVFIPAESGTPNGATKNLGANSDSKIFTYNYRDNIWAERTTSNSFSYDNMAGGIALFKNEIYFLATRRDGSYTAGLLHKFSYTNTLYDYSDNAVNIVSIFEPQWIWLDEPSLYKEFLRLKVYRFDPVPAPTTATNYTLSVKTYRNFSTSTPDTDATLSFVAGTDMEKHLKLKSNRARALLISFRVADTGNQIATHQAARISGYEIVAMAVDRQEDLVPL